MDLFTSLIYSEDFNVLISNIVGLVLAMEFIGITFTLLSGFWRR